MSCATGRRERAWRDEILKKVQESGDSRNFFDIYSSSPFRMPEGMDVEKTDADTAVYVLSRIAGEGADRFFRGRRLSSVRRRKKTD